MSIRVKLITFVVSFSILIACIIIGITSLSYRRLSIIDKEKEKLDRIGSKIAEFSNHTNNMIASNIFDFLPNWLPHIQQMNTVVKELDTLVELRSINETVAKSVDTIQIKWYDVELASDAYYRDLELLIKLLREKKATTISFRFIENSRNIEKYGEEVRILVQETVPLDVQDLTVKVGIFLISLNSQKLRINEAVEEYKQRIMVMTILISVFCVLVTLFLGILIANRISSPIQAASAKLNNFVGKSLEGEQTVRVKDEVGRLTHSVGTLIDYYRELSAVAQKLSVGDTSINITPKSEQDVMGNAFLQIVSYLNVLTEGAQEFIQGNYQHQVPVSSDKDILAETYNKLSSAIAELLEQTKEITRLETEMDAAARIQRSVLPTKQEKLPGYDIEHISIPANEVGGDIYDFRATANGNWISIGDVSGHGLESGIIALIAQSAFTYGINVFANQDLLHEPQIKMYDYVNKTLYYLNSFRNHSSSFMTQNYLFEKEGTFFCSGSHEIALLYRDQENKVMELKELTGRVPFMGILDTLEVQASDFSFSMEKDDLLLLYTDGLIEVKNEHGEQFDIHRLRELLHENSKNDLKSLKNLLVETVFEFAKEGDIKRNDGTFPDDVTFILLRKL